MSKKDKKDSDEKSSGKGKDKTASDATASALTDGSASKNGAAKNGSLPAEDVATSAKPGPNPLPAPTTPGTRTVVRAAPRTVGETVATASVAADTGSSAPVSVGSTTPVEALTGPSGSAPGSSAPVSVDTTTPVAALTEPAGGPAPSTALARRTPPAPTARDFSADDVADALLVPLRIARRVLPEGRTPVVLGVAALTLVGVVDLPVAIGIGLGWEVLRRWGPAEPPARRA